MEIFNWFASSGSPTHISHSELDSNGYSEEALSRDFENVRLPSNEEINCGHNNGDGRDGGRLHPLRPHVENCTYYLRTGTCKFGANCKFNHPARWPNPDKPKACEGFSEGTGQIECKYYLTAGGCKYGKSCRYNHSKEENESSPLELNFLGLPIRLGERECPYYMRNGSCGYGAQCRFHHPEPTAAGGYDSRNSTPNDESLRQYGIPSPDDNGESIPVHVSGEPQPAQESWSLQMPSVKAVPYQDSHSSYMPAVHFLPQETLQSPEWNEASNSPDEMERHPSLAPAVKILLANTADISSQLEEFPERPGRPECIFFRKTGDCKFKSACRYHHPKNQTPKADCVLSDKGLPLRPGKKICWHYEQLGICKYGRACLYDHASCC